MDINTVSLSAYDKAYNSIPGRSQDVQSNYGDNAASYPMDIGGSFSGGEAYH
jgi:hypothetical protein